MASSYETVLREVEALSEAEQLRLVARVSARLHVRAPAASSVSILDLPGDLEVTSGTARMLRIT